MARENYRTKAVRYLAEVRLTIRRLHAGTITVTCRGDSAEIYNMGYADDLTIRSNVPDPRGPLGR